MSLSGDPTHHRLLSKPVRISWAGWESDTWTLQQHGWDLSVDQCLDRMEMRMVVRHSASHIMGQTNSIPFQRFTGWEEINERFHPHIWQMRAMGVLNVVGDQHMELNYARYKPIDAMPRMDYERPRALSDLVHFAEAPLLRSKAIVLPEATVDELLAEILAKQQPAKTDYFRHLVDSAAREVPKHKFHAQIISLAA